MNVDSWKAEAPPGIGDTNERSQIKTARGGQMSKQSADEEREGSKLETRVTKFEEKTKWMYDRMAAAEASTWGKGVPWKQEDEGDDWRRWEGSWWIRVNQDDLNLRQRRKISRGLKRMIDREKNGMARLNRALRKGIKDEVDDSKRSVNASSESDKKSRDEEENSTTCNRRIPLVL